MSILKIIHNSRKPELYTPGSKAMWTDEYISKQLLSVHLNKEVDLASRKEKSIIKTIDWIESVQGMNRMDILDLGCGPGLYAELLAQNGHRVTGIDISKNSINYAIKSAHSKGMDIDYHTLDYLNLDSLSGRFDLVLMIFTDFGVLLPDQRNQVLASVRKLLKPSGAFVFDVLDDKSINACLAPKTWECREKGFWRQNPYLALSDSYLYKDEKVILYRHIVAGQGGGVETYHFWTHFFSPGDLEDILRKNGFTPEIHQNILVQEQGDNCDNVLFSRAVLD